MELLHMHRRTQDFLARRRRYATFLSLVVLGALFTCPPLHTAPKQPTGASRVTVRIEPMKWAETEYNPVWICLHVVNPTDRQIVVKNFSRILNDDIIKLTRLPGGIVEKQDRLLAVDDPVVGPRDSVTLYLSLDNFGSPTISPMSRYLPVAQYELTVPVITFSEDNVSMNIVKSSQFLFITPIDEELRHLQHSIERVEADTTNPDRWKTIFTIIQQYPNSTLISRCLRSLYECAITDPDVARVPEIVHSFQKMAQRYPDNPASVQMLRWIAERLHEGTAEEIRSGYVPFLGILAKKYKSRLVGEYAKDALERPVSVSISGVVR
jgi:hypothetical protein